MVPVTGTLARISPFWSLMRATISPSGRPMRRLTSSPPLAGATWSCPIGHVVLGRQLVAVELEPDLVLQVSLLDDPPDGGRRVRVDAGQLEAPQLADEVDVGGRRERSDLAADVERRVAARDALERDLGAAPRPVPVAGDGQREPRQILRERGLGGPVQEPDRAVLDADLPELEAHRLEDALRRRGRGRGGLRLGARGRAGLPGGREQPAKVERAVRRPLDVDARTPEARLHEHCSPRPVEVDADELHALDPDRGLRGARLADLDVLRPAVPLGLRDELAVPEGDAVPAVAEVAARQPGRDGDVGLVRRDRRVADGHGELRVERKHRHRPLDVQRAPARQTRRQRERHRPLHRPREVVGLRAELREHEPRGRLDVLVDERGRARRQREPLDADLREALGQTLDHREEGPPGGWRRRSGGGPRGRGRRRRAGRLGCEQLDQIDHAPRVAARREVEALDVDAGHRQPAGQHVRLPDLDLQARGGRERIRTVAPAPDPQPPSSSVPESEALRTSSASLSTSTFKTAPSRPPVGR